MRTITLTIAAAALLGSPLAAQDFRWTGSLAAGKTLEVKGVNGALRVLLADGNQIEVTARKTARHSDPASVKVEVVTSDDGVTICAVYPTPHHADDENRCAAGRGGHMNTEDNDVTVDFTVKLPAGVAFTGSTVNGEVTASGLKSDLDVATVNGGIDVATTGFAEATTVNGSIEATLGRADWRGSARFTTVNGGITVTLPADVGTELRAQTVNGDMETDFPLTITGKFGPRHLRGTIGAGGRTLELTTVNGSIRIRKAA